MKYFSILFFGLLFSCGHSQVPQNHTEHATLSDCQFVYQYIVSMIVNDQVDSEHTLSSREREGAKWELDQRWEQSGVKDRFLASCQKDMTLSQIDCIINVSHINEVHACVTLIH